MPITYLGVGDYLVIAESVLGFPTGGIARIGLIESALAAPEAAFGGTEFYPDFHQKAGILCSRLIRNHPLPDGNKRSAWLSMQMFVDLNGRRWVKPTSTREAVSITEALAAGAITEEQYISWLQPHID